MSPISTTCRAGSSVTVLDAAMEGSSEMYFSFSDIIAHVSRDEMLYPGELIGSGTVGGGCGLELDRWLQPNDVVELSIDGLGVQKNRIVRSVHH